MTERVVSDEFGSYERVLTDSVGVTTNLEESGGATILFDCAADRSLNVIDRKGNEVLKVKEIDEKDYFPYRPCKWVNGNLLCIIKNVDRPRERAIAALDRKGHVLWRSDNFWLTHDFDFVENDEFYTFVREDELVEGGGKVSNNVILKLDSKSKVMWRWSFHDNLDQFTVAGQTTHAISQQGFDNPFHANSIEFAGQDAIIKNFGEPVLLVSSRNMNTVFILGVDSEKVLFQNSDMFQGQHHARFHQVEEDGISIRVFDNGINYFPEGESRYSSRVVVLGVSSGEVLQEIHPKVETNDFFTPVVGSAYLTNNGNFLINEGYYGHLMEVNRDGQILWEYVHPDFRDPEKRVDSLSCTGLRQIYRAVPIEVS